MQVSVIENVSWKEVGLLFFVWIMILALQIGKVSIYLMSYIFNSKLVDIFFFHILVYMSKQGRMIIYAFVLKQNYTTTCSLIYWILNLLQVYI